MNEKGFKIVCLECGSDDVYASVDYNLSYACVTAMCNECDNRADNETANQIEDGKIVNRVWRGR